ncbi:flocculation protein FLO11-like isoform X3 [Sinocyclocheilus anshuiensis]|uniref:flocculation protein FLO11-like isoform X3 n=1 Tax=Sinocyclocheilus anshuiensis TaxID=1608454 RepID=UPI0007B9A416|nr:PREDICTED: flocculation protein FLO11-like isoform X3 [Sinocyclocheilus anshuiensis]
MGPEQFQSLNKIICVLCEKSDETEITGPLSSKESTSAHENCLLFASGIYSKNSPTYDDLFGFAVEDVKEEQRRGKRLLCHHCKKNGATAGCDLKRCKRSYHFPCAIEARATIDEDINKGRFKLFCELHDPKSKKPRSADGRRPDLKRPDRRDSNSSTGSSEVSVSKKKKRNSPILIDSDDDIEDTLAPIYAPVESHIEDSTSPNRYNSDPDPESKRPCARPSPSTAGSLKGGLTSDQKACGSAGSSGELHSRSAYDSLVRWAEVETPRRKKIKRILDSDDESPTSTDRVVAPAMSNTEESMLPKQPSQSSPVPEKTRPCEKLNPSTTVSFFSEADDDDTDIDSDDSQSLLQPEMYHITVPCSVIMDSGPSAESEYSLEPSSPAGAAPAAMYTSPGSIAAPEQEEPPSTSRTSPPPRAQTTDPVLPGTTDPTPNQDRASDGPTGQPGSPPNSSPTVDVPAVSISAVQTLSLLVQASHLKSEQLPEPSPPAGVSSSPGRPAAADASDVGTTEKSQSSAAIFWTRCNEAGWTKEVFSELVSQLSSLGERVQSQEASHQGENSLDSGQFCGIFQVQYKLKVKYAVSALLVSPRKQPLQRPLSPTLF